MDEIDKLDGMVKMHKCGYEFIGGCSDLRRLKQENAMLKEKLDRIKEVVKCSKEPMNCANCPICEWCEELCVNDENLQDIILQIIEGMEND